MTKTLLVNCYLDNFKVNPLCDALNRFTVCRVVPYAKIQSDYQIGGDISSVVISGSEARISKPEDKAKTEAFFDNMRRKSDAREPGPDGKKPLAELTGDGLILLDLPGWGKKERWLHFFKHYREDIVGFLLSWLVVGALILLAWGILQI